MLKKNAKQKPKKTVFKKAKKNMIKRKCWTKTNKKKMVLLVLYFFYENTAMFGPLQLLINTIRYVHATRRPLRLLPPPCVLGARLT